MVKQKVVISERDNIAALFEDEQVCEFIIHRGDVLLGDIYLAQVENILPSIDAAFVNVGTERMGFLHSSDVQGRGDLKNRLQPKQRLLVQVIKEPTGHKGPRVTTNIALPGRFLVLLPDSRGISISRKIINPKERIRLKSVLSLTKPPGVGVIIRTEAEEQTDAEIQDDFETLMERWQNVVAMADTISPPALLHRDQDLLYRVIREFVSEETTEIVVDTQFGQHRAQQLLQNWGVQTPIKVTLYEGNQSIMLGAGVDKEIKSALQTRVPLPSGGYIYVQPTEALTVVDVNSGKFTSLESQEATILHTNLEAAKEIARQLRLRNVGGMIVVDFIDMLSRANQLQVLQVFETYMQQDKGKPQIGQLSDLGLVEMTRHRQGQSLAEIFTKKCQGCHGAAHVVEEFNWAPPNAGDFGRYGSQNRFPMRQQRGGRQQGQNGQAQQGQNGQQRQVPKPGGQTLQKFVNPGARGESPLREGFLQASDKSKQSSQVEMAKTLSLAELFRTWDLAQLGIVIADSVKLGVLPLDVNQIVSRMNPKSSDIFALVKAIESSVSIDDNDEDDDDMSDDADDNNDDNNSEAMVIDGNINEQQVEAALEVVEVLSEFNSQMDEEALANQWGVDTVGAEEGEAEHAINGRFRHELDLMRDLESDDDDNLVAVGASIIDGDDDNEYEPLDDDAESVDQPEKPRRRGRPPSTRRPK